VDLSSPSSIRSFVHRFAKRDNTRLDVLVNNAAIVPHSKTVTKEGENASSFYLGLSIGAFLTVLYF